MINDEHKPADEKKSKQTVKVSFVDFWPGFIKENNYFYNLLSVAYHVELSENPDFVFYSCYGNEYLSYDCVRIFFSAENMRPDFTGCDFAITFDYLENPRHYRLPLFALHIERSNNLSQLMAIKTKNEVLESWRKKRKFCCMVVSNELAKERIEFFRALSTHRQVDSGGRTLNNVGGPVEDKLNFIKDYKFVIAFENSSYPGYTTEKILEPFVVDSIPVYWGNPVINRDFNTESFIHVASRDSMPVEKAIQQMLAMEASEELAVQMLMQPKFQNNTPPEYLNSDQILQFLINIISQKGNFVLAARSHKRFFHSLNTKGRIIKYRIDSLLGKNFR